MSFLFFSKPDFSLPDGFTVTAHTGCCKTPDNSLESIETAVKYGADTVEFDLQFTSDGEPVLSHDAPKGNNVTLDEAFKKISTYKNITVNVDVKTTTNLGKVKELADKHGITPRVFFTGIFEDNVEAVKRDCPEIPYFLNVSVNKLQSREYLLSLVKKVRDCGAVGINFNKKSATKELVETFRENGLLVSIWTAKTKGDIYRILALSPDNITTRRPDLAKKILNR